MYIVNKQGLERIAYLLEQNLKPNYLDYQDETTLRAWAREVEDNANCIGVYNAGFEILACHSKNNTTWHFNLDEWYLDYIEEEEL